MSGVVLYWSKRDQHLVLEVRPRWGVVRKGLLWESVREGLALNIVASFLLLEKVDSVLAEKVLCYLVTRLGIPSHCR